MCSKIAEEDKKMVERWQKVVDGIIVFVRQELTYHMFPYWWFGDSQ